jgi:hypothetical protein
MEWIRDHALFYEHALAEWESAGPLHVSGRSNLAAFEAAVRQRCGGAWEPHLVPAIRAYYFQARRTGNAPKYHRLDTAELEQRERTEDRAEEIRQRRVVEAVDEAEELEALNDELYPTMVDSRINQAQIKLHEWGDTREDLLKDSAHASLLAELDKRRQRQDARHVALGADQRRADRLALTELRIHLQQSYGEVCSSSPFFHHHLCFLDSPRTVPTTSRLFTRARQRSPPTSCQRHSGSATQCSETGTHSQTTNTQWQTSQTARIILLPSQRSLLGPRLLEDSGFCTKKTGSTALLSF